MYCGEDGSYRNENQKNYIQRSAFTWGWGQHSTRNWSHFARAHESANHYKAGTVNIGVSFNFFNLLIGPLQFWKLKKKEIDQKMVQLFDSLWFRDLQNSQSINFRGTRAWRTRVVSLVTVLILIILVLVIVVAIKDQDRDAKIAEVDKKATDSILKRQKNGLLLGTVRLVYTKTSLHQIFFRRIPKGG